MKNNYSKNVFCSDHFRTMSEELLAVWQFLFDWVVKAACYVSVAILEEKEHWRKILLSNLVIELKFFDFCRTFFRGVVKTAFYVSIGKSWRKKKFRPKKCLLPNSHKLRTFLAFGWNLSGGVFKTALYVFIKTISEEKFLKKMFI